MKSRRMIVISDTHGTLRPEVLERAAGCEAILHAGDVDRPELLERLKALAPVYAVRGNVDGEWAESLPEELELELFGFRIYMIHNKKRRRKDLSGIDLVVCGHSHEYQDAWDEKTGIRYLNPGSCGPKRFRLPVTMMELTLYPEEHRAEVTRLDCEAGTAKEDTNASVKSELSERDLYQLVKKVVKGMRAGRSVPEMAERYQTPEKLVEDICRMYATHPGINVDGIMDRLERRGL